MTSILGISAFYHDSAAALVVDGNIVAAAQEERFTRIKHDSSYPFHAVNFVLKYSNLNLRDIDGDIAHSGTKINGKNVRGVVVYRTA